MQRVSGAVNEAKRKRFFRLLYIGALEAVVNVYKSIELIYTYVTKIQFLVLEDRLCVLCMVYCYYNL